MRHMLDARAGVTIYASTGMIGFNQPDRMSTLHFYHAVKGDSIRLLDDNYYFNVATYSLDFDDKYIYTYSYQENESWTTYRGDLRGDTYRKGVYIFEEEVFFRICLKRADGKDFTEYEAERINEILLFETSYKDEYIPRKCFEDEIIKTAADVKKFRNKNSVVLGLLTDSHYTVNGTWHDTAYNISAVHSISPFDAIVHLGDLTDGMVPKSVTRDYVNIIINDLKKTNVPLYIAIGNHDTNYFRGNKEPFTIQEQCEIYLKNNCLHAERDMDKPYYYVDFNDINLRSIFLYSFDYNENVRYGFPSEEILWLDKVLCNTPDNYKIVVFSHVPPLAEIHYWSNEIRNGNELIEILEKHSDKVMAYIHGHNHADQIYTKRKFPIISIGSTKIEYFEDKKPEGALTPKRKLNTLSQDLWDVLIITPSENRINLLRFGAGEDRTIYC